MRIKTLVILLLFIGKLCAISPYKTYSVTDGMPNSTVKAICQDTLGYIWMGTHNGLVRFDGYEFHTYNYNIEEKNSVSNNDITCFTLDRLGRIWIGTFNWITLFDPFTEQFIKPDFIYPEETLPQGVVTNIWFDDRDRIWVSAKNGLYVISNNEVRTVNALSGAYINCMGAVDRETLLVEVMGRGAALFNTTTDELTWLDESRPPHRPMIYKIHRDNTGRVWAGADSNHIYEFDDNTASLRQVYIDLPKALKSDNEQIHDIIEYNDSTLIFGTDNGLLAINKHTLEYQPDIVPGLHTDWLSGYRVMCLFQDRQQAIWTGTFGKGVLYTNPNRYHFNLHEFPAGYGVVGQLVEKDGKLWIGHESGLTSMDLATERMEHTDLKSQLRMNGKKTEVFSLHHNPTDDLLYIYLLNRGLYAFDTRSKRIVRQIDLPPSSQVRSMAEDKQGNMWIAEEELSVYEPATGRLNNFLSTNINNITSFMLTQDMLLRSNGNMLVATRTSGVWEYPYDETNKNKYSIAQQMNYEELSNKNVNVLFEDSKFNLWIGTYGSGLFLFNKEKRLCQHYSTDNGLANNSVCGIIEDEHTGEIWCTTISGISKINPSDGKIINYTDQTGFPLKEVSRKAFLKASNGMFYVGGNNGLTSFNPELFAQSPHVPAATISLVRSLSQSGNNNEYRFDNQASLQNIRIPFRYSTIEIKFSALDYFFPQGNSYCYKLEGVDEGWNTTERNEVVYTTLHEGKYTFKIKAGNNEGHWSDQTTEVQITILPPFWRTIGAKVFYVLLIAGIIYLVFLFFSSKKTAKYKQQINQIEKDNIERYYQMKLELFTKFSHELRTPLTLITGPAEDLSKDETLPGKFRYPVELIHKNANRLLLLVNQLMDVRKMEHGAMKLRISQVDINSFLTDQIENFDALARKKDIRLKYQNQYWGKNVWFDTELMEKVIFNLLSNAIKYTPAGGEIIISTQEQDDHLLISVRDNGEGIPSESLEDIFNPFYQVHQGQHAGIPGSGVGLNLAKYVVNLHGGRIWAESVLGQGSEFFVELPFGILHFDESHTEIISNENASDNDAPTTEKQEYNPDKILSDNKTWILVTEDDEELRKYIVSLLRDDYSVLEASNGQEALELANEKIPDLIISDVMMPHMDGIELCQHIKNDINTAHTPVILLTAKIMNESIQEGYEALADDYIAKPFNPQLLKVRIKNLIENRHHLRELFGNQMSALDVPVAEVSRTDPFMEKLFSIVERRIDDPELSINDIAAEIGVSRAQFFRKVKAVSDISPQKLILNIRMKMAVDIIRKDEHTIAEVAYKVGFNDPAYFSKSFKAFFGVSPTDFIKQMKR